ncbi:MAG: bifunctional serine/threonine-protein kinase/formylglycine-generating enzyme family protein [Cellvibrionaceae bacterium]
MQIPGYRVIRKINQGGMSTVYMAIQKSVGREVALKVMSPALNADPVFSERFQREANIVGQLSHPNIIAIYDIGCHKNLNYIAMDYLPGGTIHDKMQAGMTTDEVLKVIKEVATALNVAHNKWFVHRDIKPENILFRADGTAVLTDFGVAKAVSSSSNVTNAGTVVGTPYYMSPEQARGKTLDRRSDLYSLGIVFYEMLTGSVPYKADEVVAIAIKHLTQPVPTLPPQYSIYQSILDRLLAKEPDDRFQSGAELVAAIETVQSTLSGFPNNPSNYTDPSSMSVMALFKALMLTSYAALKLRAKKLIEKILHWRWTPNRGFYKRPNVKVTEIRTESFNDDQNRATIVSTRVQKAAHFEESIGSKFSYITRAFTWVFILSIIWSSFSVGMIRLEAPLSKILPNAIAEAMLSTSGVIETYANKILGEPVERLPAKPNLDMLSYKKSTKPQLPNNNTLEYTLDQTRPNSRFTDEEMLDEELTPEEPTNNKLIESDIAELERMSLERYNSDFNHSSVNAAQYASLNSADFDNALKNSRMTETDAENFSTEPTDLKENNLSKGNTELNAEKNDNEEGNELDSNVKTSTELLAINTPKEKKAVPIKKPTYPLTVKVKPAGSRVRILNIKEKYSDGIKLKNGKYRIEVSKKSYGTIVQNVRIKNKALTLKYSLREIIGVGDSIKDSLKIVGKGPELVIIPNGTFVMGSNNKSHLSPERLVTIPKRLAVSKYEITFDDYEKFAQSTNRPIPKDNRWGRGNRPVINVNWNSAIAYTEWLSKQTGKKYRLPSEAEWEYFSKAGIANDFWWGGSSSSSKNSSDNSAVNNAIDRANCKKGCGDKARKEFKNKTAPVGSFAINPFLLYDTSGNVAEWTQDCYKNNYEHAPTDGKSVSASNCKKRTIRGGSLKDNIKNISNVERKGMKSNAKEDYIGFRVVREID